MELTFRSLCEDRPGAAWRRVFSHGWPGWREWFLNRGGERVPEMAAAQRALRRYMPEIEPLWQSLVEKAGADEDAARFLTFWSPPRYLVNCSQAVLIDREGPLLIRNYDLDPELNESTLLSTAWRGRRIAGMVEGMAGLADGMNDAGLAISLSFGGRPVCRAGFGVPIILRYVLEMCADVQDAVDALRRVPSHMSYNVTVFDRSGVWATVLLAPDRPTVVTRQPYATNHQIGVGWPGHGRISNTLEREARLKSLLSSDNLSGAELASEFQAAPLFSTAYRKGFGTVYTSAYRPRTGEISLSWRKGPPITWHLDRVDRREVRVVYTPTGSSVLADGPSCSSQDQEASEPGNNRLAAVRLRNHTQSAEAWVNLNEAPLDPATRKESA